MKEIKLEELNLNPFTAFGKDWMALSAGNEQDGCNSMTVSWGHLGIVWDDEKGYLPTPHVYVRPQRYTKKFMDCEEYFTLSYLGSGQHKPLGVLGSKSGRDGDKVALTKLTPIALEHGVYFEQAELSFVCKKLYAHQFEKEQVPQEVADWIYNRMPPHTMFIGEIVDVIEK